MARASLRWSVLVCDLAGQVDVTGGDGDLGECPVALVLVCDLAGQSDVVVGDGAVGERLTAVVLVHGLDGGLREGDAAVASLAKLDDAVDDFCRTAAI